MSGAVMGNPQLVLEPVSSSTESGEVLDSVRARVAREVREYVEYLRAAESRVGRKPTRQVFDRVVPAFSKRMTGVIGRCDRIVQDVRDKRIRQLIKKEFRARIAPWTKGNPLINRALKKPKGYAGDYLMLELGYANNPKYAGGLSGVFDRCFIDALYCVAYRKDKLKELIRLRIEMPRKKGRVFRMLSLGSGPCREWYELERELRRSKVAPRQVALSCLDQDIAALGFAKSRLRGNWLLASTEFFQGNLLNFTQQPRWRERQESYDLIYGLGIANYFYNESLKKVIGGPLPLLKVGGELAITHKDANRFRFPIADWLCDWLFIKRSEEEFLKIIRESTLDVPGKYEARIEREDCGEIMYGMVKRLQ